MTCLRLPRWGSLALLISTTLLACSSSVIPDAGDATNVDSLSDSPSHPPGDVLTSPDASDAGPSCDGSSPLSCGPQCTPCSAPTHATPACSMGTCTFTCDAGYERVGAECLPEPPALLSPLSSWTINHRNPEFRTSTHSEYREYINEICDTRACAPPLIARWTHSGTPSPSPVAIPPGRLFYWRSTGVLRDGRMRTSPAVPFKTTTRATRGYDTVFFDFDGDGFADVLSAHGRGTFAFQSNAQVTFGAASLLVRPDLPLPRIQVPARPLDINVQSLQLIGDFDGDGYSDAAVIIQQLQLHFGGARVRTEPRVATINRDVNIQAFPDDRVSRSVVPVGDINGDGLSDFVLTEYNGVEGKQELSVFLGNREGALRPSYHTVGVGARTVVRGPDCTADGRGFRYMYAINRPSPNSTVAVAGSVSFSEWAITAVGAESFIDFPFPSIEDVGDIDGDGRNEAVVHSVRYNDSRALLLSMPTCGRLEATPINLVPNTHAVARTTDLDGDGTHELIFARVATPDAPELLVAFRGGPAFAMQRLAAFSRDPAQLYAVPDTGPHSFAGRTLGTPGDMDGDGFDDLVVGDLGEGRPQFIVLRGRADLSRWPGEPISLRLSTAPMEENYGFIASRSPRSVRRWLFARR